MGKKDTSAHGKRILEVGAGIGATTVALRDVPFDRWVCVEPDAFLCEKIRKKRSAGDVASEVEVRNCTASELVGEKFDTILYIDVLEHIENDREELKLASKLLVEGGKIIVLSPAHNYLFSPFDRKIGHYRRYDKRLMTNIVPEGLVVRQMQYLDSIGYFASLANKLILKQSDPSRSQIAFWDSVMVPLSKIFDPILYYLAGKSILAAFQKEAR